jgi:hypothetical protein
MKLHPIHVKGKPIVQSNFGKNEAKKAGLLRIIFKNIYCNYVNNRRAGSFPAKHK